ncbi:hypothetical protein [Halorussus sp. AFM4]|uniref:hypothetical protein n=1 Tax=Halorussus sp. AFM4 TaxID=3421651 RepID=UPI003EBC7B8B
MDELEEVRAKLAMASSGLENTRQKAEDLEEVDDDTIDDIKTARDVARRALERVSGEE